MVQCETESPVPIYTVERYVVEPVRYYVGKQPGLQNDEMKLVEREAFENLQDSRAWIVYRVNPTDKDPFNPAWLDAWRVRGLHVERSFQINAGTQSAVAILMAE